LTETLAPGVRRLPTPTAEGLAPAAVETPEEVAAPLALQPTAAPLAVAPLATAEAPAAPLNITPWPPAEAEAPAAPLVVTVPVAVAAPAADNALSEAGDGAERSPGPNAAAPALAGSLPPDLAQLLPAAVAFAPRLSVNGEGADESTVAA